MTLLWKGRTANGRGQSKEKGPSEFSPQKTQVICNSLSFQVLRCKFYDAPRGTAAYAPPRTSVITINTTVSQQLSDVFLKEIKLLNQFQVYESSSADEAVLEIALNTHK